MRRPAVSRRALATLALALALVAFPLGALASHDFGDVPDANLFHADISALVASGVTSGCGGGNYCPSANVTREQMAAFLNRLGALAPGKTPVVNATKLDGLDSTQFERSDTVTTGRFNCPGAAMQPTEDGLDYLIEGNERVLNTGDGYFNCAILMPNGATVTSFKVGVYDGVVDQYIECGLYQAPLFTQSGGSVIAFAQSDSPGTPGNQLLEDNVISATVDNEQYSYVAECYVSAAGFSLTLNGVSVEYTVAGAQLP